MDPTSYVLGISFGLMAGVVFGFGTVMQKLAINSLPKDSELMHSLIKNKVWVSGLLLQFTFGSIFLLLSQLIIGPALVPGLTAIGLIILAIGSIKIVGERLKPSEIMGILLMIFGIFLLCFSGLSIEIAKIAFMNVDFLFRAYLYSGILFTLVGILYYFQKKNKQEGLKGIMLALASGILYSIENIWIAIMMVLALNLFMGGVILVELAILGIGLVFTVIINVYGVIMLQQAFQTGQASNLSPIQTVPIQLGPIIIYFFVFLLIPPSFLSILYLILGIILILFSSFLLGKRQAQLEEI